MLTFYICLAGLGWILSGILCLGLTCYWDAPDEEIVLADVLDAIVLFGPLIPLLYLIYCLVAYCRLYLLDKTENIVLFKGRKRKSR